MAALPYIQFYVADYLSDTMHLETDEHGAYLLLIMNYWQTGKPIQEKRIQAITRLSNERLTDVKETLREFFNVSETGLWIHERIERDLEKVHEKSTKASIAGRKSAEKRWRNNEKVTDAITDVNETLQQKYNHTDTDTDTDTDINKPNGLIPYQEIVNLYIENLPELPGVLKIDDKRKRLIKKLWTADPGIKDLESFDGYFKHVKQIKFLTGGNSTGWTADFNFLVNPTNFLKIIEGKYK